MFISPWRFSLLDEGHDPSVGVKRDFMTICMVPIKMPIWTSLQHTWRLSSIHFVVDNLEENAETYEFICCFGYITFKSYLKLDMGHTLFSVSWSGKGIVTNPEHRARTCGLLPKPYSFMIKTAVCSNLLILPHAKIQENQGNIHKILSTYWNGYWVNKQLSNQ